MKYKILVLITLVLFLGVFNSTYSPPLNSDTYISPLNSPELIKEMGLSSGESWLTGWSYRQEITITGQSGAGTNYQIKVPFNYDDTGVTGELNFSSHCQTDFDDLRFTDNDGETLLDFWIEEKTDSDDGIAWVEVADDLSSGTVDIYAYYGNDGVSTTSSGDDTFLLYEDWSSQSIDTDKWDVTGTATVTYSDTNANHGYVQKIDVTTASAEYFQVTDLQSTAPSAIIGRMLIADTAANYQRLAWGINSYSQFACSQILSASGTTYHRTIDEDINDDSDAISDANIGSYKTYQLTRDGTNAKLYVDYSLINTNSMEPDTVEGDAIGIYVRDTEYDFYSDWMAVRKYVATEPSISSFAAEESEPMTPQTGPQPVITNAESIDGENVLFQHYRTYYASVNVSDGDGYANVDYVKFQLKNATSGNYGMKYTESTDTFESDTNTDWGAAKPYSCSATKTGDDIQLVFAFMMRIGDSATNTLYRPDMGIQIIVMDDDALSNTTQYYGYNYTIDGRVNIDLSLDDGVGTPNRGDLDGAITATVTLGYTIDTSYYPTEMVLFDSGWRVFVQTDGEGANGAYWEFSNYDGGLDGDGIGTVTVYADDEVGSDTFTARCGNIAMYSGETANTTTATYIADNIVFSISTNSTWQLINVYANVSYTCVYDYDDTSYSGSLTLSYTTGVITKSSAVNQTFSVISFSDTTHGITTMTNNSVWVAWDTIEFTSEPAYYWTQYSPDAVWLIWGAPSNYVWALNSSAVQDGIIIQSQRNETDNAWATIYGGSIAGFCIGAFDSSWYSVTIDIRAQTGGLDWIIWTKTLTVDILHSVHIEDSTFYLTDNWVTIGFQINWNNGTFYVYDNGSYVGGAYNGGLYQFAKSTTTGLHNLTVIVNGTQSSIDESTQNYTSSSSDGWKVIYFAYTVNPVTFSITDLFVMQNNDSIILSGWFHTPTLMLTWEAFENDVSISTGTLTLTASGEYHAIYWEKNEPTLLKNFTLTITAGSSSLSVHGYSFVIDTATYLSTYEAASFFEGDSITNVYVDEEQVESQAFWNTIGLIIVSVFIPVAIGLGFGLSELKKRRPKRDKSEDIYRIKGS